MRNAQAYVYLGPALDADWLSGLGFEPSSIGDGAVIFWSDAPEEDIHDAFYNSSAKGAVIRVDTSFEPAYRGSGTVSKACRAILDQGKQ